jgi:ferric-dicitrate binding protein FerR (iron transport regulator)
MGVVAAEPKDQEAEEWAEREKKRREAWLAGPSEAEKREWSRRQREVRELYGASDKPDSELERELERRLRRDVHLARAGILGLLLNLPYSVGAKLIRSGLDAQYDYYTEPAFRRRVPPDFSSGGD